MPYVELTAPFFDGKEKYPRGTRLFLDPAPRSAKLISEDAPAEPPPADDVPPELQPDPTLDAQPGDTLASLTKAKK